MMDVTGAFEQFCYEFDEAAKAEVQAMKDVEDAKDDMDVAGYQVEVGVITEAGGDEKKVGTTEAARNRAYALAKNKSVSYTEAKKFHLSAKMEYRYRKHMLRMLELRGQFIVASKK